MYLQKRSIALCIVLSLVTCGIYMYYWMYKLAEDHNYLKNDPTAMSPGLVVVLSIVTCNIYFMYWMYKAGENVDNIRVQQGFMPGSKGILYLILTVFGLSIVAMALLQSDYNLMADGMNNYDGGDNGDRGPGGYYNGGYGNGGYNNGGYNNGGYNNGGYNNGGYNNGGYNNSGYNNGSYNNGGYNNGGYNNGGYGGQYQKPEENPPAAPDSPFEPYGGSSSSGNMMQDLSDQRPEE